MVLEKKITAAKRTYGVELSSLLRPYEERSISIERPLAPDQSLPVLTRSGPLDILSMSVRRTIPEATYVVESSDGTNETIVLEDPADVPDGENPVVVTIEERLKIPVRLMAAVMLMSLAVIALGVGLAGTKVGSLRINVWVLLLFGVIVATADGYTRIRDRDDEPLNDGVLHSMSDPFGHWLLLLLLGFLIIAIVPGRVRTLGIGWVGAMVLLPVIPPLRWVGTAVSNWLHGWTVISESRAIFPGPIGDPFSGGLKHRLAKAEDDTDIRLLPTFVGQWTSGDTHCQYRFSFESVDGGTRVVQRVVLKRTAWAMQVLVLPVLSVFILWLGWKAVEAGIMQDPANASLDTTVQLLGLINQLVPAFGFVGVYIAIVGPTLIQLSRRPNLLGQIRELSESYVRVETTFDALFAAPAAACFLFGVFRGQKTLLLIAGALIACQIVVVSIGVIDGRPLLWIRRGFGNLIGGTPLAARYARAVTFMMLPLAVFGFAQFALGPTLADSGSLPMVDLLSVVCIVLFVATFILDLTTEVFRTSRHAARRKSVTPTSIVTGVVIIAACSAATYLGLGYILELWVFDGLLGITTRPYAAFDTTIAVASLLFLTVPISAVVQTSVGLESRLEPPSTVQKLSRPATDAVSATVYVIRDDSPISEVASTFRGSDYILISTKMLEMLNDERQIAAVLAHEQAHIDHGDTKLGLMLPILGTLTLTGQNVLFDLFDIPEREHQADLAAATTLGSATPLLEVFDKLDDLESRTDANRVGTGTLGAVPTNDQTKMSSLSIIVRPFRLFYGAFALADVHPDIAVRRQRLRTEFDEKS